MSTPAMSSSWCSTAKSSINDGYVYKPGDFVLLKEGTMHNSRTETGATLAVFVREAERNL